MQKLKENYMGGVNIALHIIPLLEGKYGDRGILAGAGSLGKVSKYANGLETTSGICHGGTFCTSVLPLNIADKFRPMEICNQMINQVFAIFMIT